MIQVVSAMLLQLVQSCCSKPSVDDAGAACFASAASCAKSFVVYFIQRCSKKQQSIEYRMILENFVDDLLSCLSMPEWPAASIVLHQLVSHLLTAFSTSSSEPQQPFQLLALKLVGTICAKSRAVSSSIDTFPLFQEISEQIKVCFSFIFFFFSSLKKN